jgi:hypothetical protein
VAVLEPARVLFARRQGHGAADLRPFEDQPISRVVNVGPGYRPIAESQAPPAAVKRLREQQAAEAAREAAQPAAEAIRPSEETTRTRTIPVNIGRHATHSGA